MVQIMCGGVIYEAPEIEFAEGDIIVCEDGSKGVITSVRRKSILCKDGHGYVQAGDLECVFAHPVGVQHRERIPGGWLITTTPWFPVGKGNLRGLWYYEHDIRHIATKE